MDKFNGKYRIASHRRPGWDYDWNASYFITFVTQHRRHHFGHIANARMVLHDFGKIARREWYQSFEMRRELQLDAFVMMPNHIHAIVTIQQQSVAPVETHGRASLRGSRFERKPKSISSFLAGYKSAVVRSIDDWIDEQALSIPKFNRRNPFWQANYHDRVIRNADEFERIAWYIRQNPQNWKADGFYG
ncbi:MAG: transposase [Cyclonatronaceae bacterium]